jgi:hypothetical protein
MNIIRNKEGKSRTNTNEIQGVIRGYFENLYSNKLRNLEEVDQFLDIYYHSELNQEAINHLNKSVTTNKIEATIISQKEKCPRPDGFTAEF